MQLKAIGDTLMCEPAIAAIRKEYPQARISFITSNVAYPILKYHPDIDKFYIWNKKTPALQYLRFLLSLRKERFDVLIDFHKNPRSYTFAAIIRAGLKISFRSKRRNRFYNVLLDNYDLKKYVPIEKLRLAKYILSSDTGFTIPKVYVQDEHRAAAAQLMRKAGIGNEDRVLIVSPVSKVAFRLWKPINFARLCDFLQDNYKLRILFTWGPGEKHIVEELIRLMQTAAPTIDYQIDSLHVLSAVYERALLWIGNDSGPRHLAIGAGLPTFTPFGHFYWRHWTPPNTDLHLCVEPELKADQFDGDLIDSLDYQKVEDACKTWLDKVLPRIRK